MATKQQSGTVEFIKTVVYAVAIAIFIRTFFYEPFSIPSPSMVPTLLVGDYLFVSKFSYGFSRYSLPFGINLFSGRLFERSPERGDVVVFKWPRDPSVDYIKRVIGLPGDRIQVKQEVLYINDQPVKREKLEPYLYVDDYGSTTSYQQYMETLPNGVRHRIMEGGPSRSLSNTDVFTVPPGHYFMMGDNRDNSSDSRAPEGGVGYVPAENLVGHAQFIFLSTSDYGHLWQVWKLPFTTRYSRLMHGIE
jgi:signal peptidase I